MKILNLLAHSHTWVESWGANLAQNPSPNVRGSILHQRYALCPERGAADTKLCIGRSPTLLFLKCLFSVFREKMLLFLVKLVLSR